MENKLLKMIIEENEMEKIVEIEIGKEIKEKLEKETVEIIKTLIDKVKD